MNPEDLSIEELQKLLAEKQKSQQEEADNNQPEASVGEDFTVSKKPSSRKGGKTPVVAGENQWSDTGEFKDVSTPEVPRSQRKRNPPKKVELTCHVCGKRFKILSSLVSGKFVRCDSCTR